MKATIYFLFPLIFCTHLIQTNKTSRKLRQLAQAPKQLLDPYNANNPETQTALKCAATCALCGVCCCTCGPSGIATCCAPLACVCAAGETSLYMVYRTPAHKLNCKNTKATKSAAKECLKSQNNTVNKCIDLIKTLICLTN